MKNIALYIMGLILLASCSGHPDVPASSTVVKRHAAIFPDYCDVTVPCNIAPLNFKLVENGCDACVARITTPDGSQQTYGEGLKVMMEEEEWHQMLRAAQGKSLQVEVWGRSGDSWKAFQPFSIHVAEEEIDEYVSYRLIEPSYVMYNYMEIAQRNTTSFEERQIFNNQIGCDDQKGQCINCHSYQNYKTDNMLFHVRVTRGATVIVQDGKVTKTNLKRDNTISAGVYPAWHPTEKLIAFSTNSTQQTFHTSHINKVEVFDKASDLILYDVEKDEVSIICNDEERLEVFPTWSHDGRYLYYCSTIPLDSVYANANIEGRYEKLQYNLYRRTFDPATRCFGEEELVYDAASLDRSVSLPRVSPDCGFVLFAEGRYGCFHIWHHDADIVCMMLDGAKAAGDTEGVGSTRIDMSIFNGRDVADSYPSWSSNGRWMMCASRRDDGNYGRIYIAYFDGEKVYKPFLLPQEDPDHNLYRLKSYNRPEFMVEPVKVEVSELGKILYE